MGESKRKRMDHAQSPDSKRHRVISNSAFAISSIAAQPESRPVDYAATVAYGARARECGREEHDESSRQTPYAVDVEESHGERQDPDTQMTVEETPASLNGVQRSLSEAPNQDVDMLSEADDNPYCDDDGIGSKTSNLLDGLSEQQLRELRQFFGVDEGTLYIK